MEANDERPERLDNNDNEECAEGVKPIGITAHGVRLKDVCMGLEFARFYLRSAEETLKRLEEKINNVIQSLWEKEANK